jgi:hypothetical protein
MRYLLIFTFIIISRTFSYGCSCESPDSSNLDEWYDWADIVVEGTFKSALNPSVELLERLNKQDDGYTGKFEVTRTLKGSINSKEIAVFQFDSGNCTRIFKKGTSYVIFGTIVNKVVCNKNLLEFDERIEGDSTEPPPKEQDAGTIGNSNCNEDELEYWNNTTNKYLTITTGYCSTFYSNSELGKLVMKN